MTPCEAPIPRRVRLRKGVFRLPAFAAWFFYALMLLPSFEITRALLSIGKACFPKKSIPQLPEPPWDGTLGLTADHPIRCLVMIFVASLVLFAIRHFMQRWVTQGLDDRILLKHGRAIPATLLTTQAQGNKRVSRLRYWLDGKETEKEFTHTQDFGRPGATLTLMLSHNGSRQVLYEMMDYELVT